MLLSIDTETTGVDLWHGCRPFFVSLCWQDGSDFFTDFYEWSVDPHTRLPVVPQEDLTALRQHLARIGRPGTTAVLHNTKFDKRALSLVGVELPWEGVEDTLVGSHVLCSNESHGLKDLCLLHCDIPDDDQLELKEATNEARKIARKLGWNIARPNHPHWPAIKSVKDGWWVFDTWLPRAVAKHFWETTGDPEWSPARPLRYPATDDDPSAVGEPEAFLGHPWWTVLRTYALRDAERTLALWLIQKPALREEKLWEIYEHRRSLLETTYDMEQYGVTFDMSRTVELKFTFETRWQDAMAKLNRIVGSLPYGRHLAHPPPKLVRGKPKEQKPIPYNPGSTLQNRVILYDHNLGFGLSVKKWTNPKEAEPGPSTDKDVIKELLDEAEPQTKVWEFLTNLVRVRKATKHVEYLTEYELSGLPLSSQIIPYPVPKTPRPKAAQSPKRLPRPTPKLQHHG